MVAGALGSGRIRPGEYGWGVPLLIVLFCLLALHLSTLPFFVARWPRPDGLAVGMEVTMRNINLALLLKALLFPAATGRSDPVGDGVLFAILFYAGTALVVGPLLALNFRRMARNERPGAPALP
jgi:BASS family bile acid:Na+ symporter